MGNKWVANKYVYMFTKMFTIVCNKVYKFANAFTYWYERDCGDFAVMFTPLFASLQFC
ncbi:hypothetical protein J2X07_003002 [Fictibacillus barbaricus]|uniref:Uncharacterized protein n=1 Tax=Fictibacillus barbaricus TaxID=182136 RepID=A0ABU1U3E3_9BACL|nr:hypothetical protein [Fictibacillus barbaricus]